MWLLKKLWACVQYLSAGSQEELITQSTTYLYNRVGLGPECISSCFDGFACCTGHAKRDLTRGDYVTVLMELL